MIKQEKKLDWIKDNSETALEKTGDLQASLFDLDFATTAAAKDVLDKLNSFNSHFACVGYSFSDLIF